jgi:hypothetical protein
LRTASAGSDAVVAVAGVCSTVCVVVTLGAGAAGDFVTRDSKSGSGSVPVSATSDFEKSAQITIRVPIEAKTRPGDVVSKLTRVRHTH